MTVGAQHAKHGKPGAQPLRGGSGPADRPSDTEVVREGPQAILQLRKLYEISKLLTRFESVEQTVPKILTLLTATIPLRVATLMLERQGEGSATRSIVWHAEGASAARLQAASARGKTAYGHLVRPRAESRVEEEAGQSPLPVTLPPPPPDEDGEAGFVLLPLVVGHGGIFGALQLESLAPLDEPDLAFVSAVVNQLAIALDRAAIDASRRAEAQAGRAAAEQAATAAQRAEKTQRFLSDTSALLMSSLEYRKTLGVVVRAAVPLLADVCVIDELAEDGTVLRLEVAVADPLKEHLAERLREFPPGPGWPPSQVLRSGESVLLVELSKAERATQDDAHAKLLDEIGVDSMMSVPLVARGHTFGALTFATAGSGRRYSTENLALAEEIGRRSAVAIDHARLYERAQRATHDREELLAIVSHDLRNPLAAILMNTELMARASGGDDRRKTHGQLETIKRAAGRMNRLIQDLLDSASIEAGRLSLDRRPQAPAPIVEAAIESFAPLASGKSINLKSELVAELPAIFADGDRLHQVFANLLGNAVKFTPGGGTITVCAVKAEGVVQFSVSDTGPGIPEEDLPHIFERFWQARRTARQGTGLGLSIARGIVVAHGGRIWVESRVGAGTRFHFTMPVLPA